MDGVKRLEQSQAEVTSARLVQFVGVTFNLLLFFLVEIWLVFRPIEVSESLFRRPAFLSSHVLYGTAFVFLALFVLDVVVLGRLKAEAQGPVTILTKRSLQRYGGSVWLAGFAMIGGTIVMAALLTLSFFVFSRT